MVHSPAVRLARTAPGAGLLMFASPRTSSGYGGARLMAMDPATGVTTPSAELGTNWAYAQGIDVADVDNDGTDEIFLSSANLYDPFFSLYDFASGTAEWTSPAGYASAASVAHADFSGDGRADFLTLGTDGRITIFNAAQSNVIWQSTQLNGGGVKAVTADLDNDGLPRRRGAHLQLSVHVRTILELRSVPRAEKSGRRRRRAICWWLTRTATVSWRSTYSLSAALTARRPRCRSSIGSSSRCAPRPSPHA